MSFKPAKPNLGMFCGWIGLYTPPQNVLHVLVVYPSIWAVWATKATKATLRWQTYILQLPRLFHRILNISHLRLLFSFFLETGIRHYTLTDSLIIKTVTILEHPNLTGQSWSLLCITAMYRRGPPKSTPASVQCQKCLKRDMFQLSTSSRPRLTFPARHYSYECKASSQDRPYVSRPSRTQQLFNPKLVPKLASDEISALQQKQ